MLIPPVRRNNRRPTFDFTGYLAFILGTALGGLSIGLSLFVLGGLLSGVPLSLRAAVFVAVSAFCALVELDLVQRELPQRKKMIPPDRFELGVRRGLAVFGFELGLGFRTYVPHVGPYLVASAALLVSPQIETVIILATGWALGRGMIVLLRVLAGGQDDRDYGLGEMTRIDDKMATIASSAAKIQVAAVSVVSLAVLAN